MEVEDILSYVTNTPGNTNPNVLKPMLNELKGSGGGGVLVCHGTVTDNGDNTTTYSIDKTWKEIHDAEFAVLVWTPGVFPAGGKVYNYVALCIPAEGQYAVQFVSHISAYLFASGHGGVLETDSENDYPSYTAEK